MELFFAVTVGSFLIAVGLVVLAKLLGDLYRLLKQEYLMWKLKREILKVIKSNEEIIKMLGDD